MLLYKYLFYDLWLLTINRLNVLYYGIRTSFFFLIVEILRGPGKLLCQ